MIPPPSFLPHTARRRWPVLEWTSARTPTERAPPQRLSCDLGEGLRTPKRGGGAACLWSSWGRRRVFEDTLCPRGQRRVSIQSKNSAVGRPRRGGGLTWPSSYQYFCGFLWCRLHSSVLSTSSSWSGAAPAANLTVEIIRHFGVGDFIPELLKHKSPHRYIQTHLTAPQGTLSVAAHAPPPPSLCTVVFTYFLLWRPYRFCTVQEALFYWTKARIGYFRAVKRDSGVLHDFCHAVLCSWPGREIPAFVSRVVRCPRSQNAHGAA